MSRISGLALGQPWQFAAILPKDLAEQAIDYLEHDLKSSDTQHCVNMPDSNPQLVLFTPDCPALLLFSALQQFKNSRFLVWKAQPQACWQDIHSAEQFYNQPLPVEVTTHQTSVKSSSQADQPRHDSAIDNPHTIPTVVVATMQHQAVLQPVAPSVVTKAAANLAVAPLPAKSNTLTDAKLLYEIFKFTVWGLDRQENLEQVQGLLLQASEREVLTPGLLASAQKQRNLGEHAYKLGNSLLKRYQQQGETAEFTQWFSHLTTGYAAQNHLVIKHLNLVLNKARCSAIKHQNYSKPADCSVVAPQIKAFEPHPNSLRHLPAHQHWEIFIDETGSEFDQVEQLNISDHKLGRYVALAVPKGKVSLPLLKKGFHAVNESSALLDHTINSILSQPVGVVGLSAKDHLSYRQPRWFSGIVQLIKLCLRLLPLPPINTATSTNQVHIFIENRGIFDAGINLQAIEQLLLSELHSLDAQRFKNLHLSIKCVSKDGHAYLSYVDALAHTWGGSSAQQRLKLAKFKGHCFLNPQEVALERLYAALDGRTPLKPSDWYSITAQLADEPSHSMLHEALQQLGQHCQQQPVLWQHYLQEIQYRLQRKQYQPRELDRILDWLTRYQPANKKLPPLLQLQWLTARLAGDNHMGRIDLALIEQALTLCQQLQDENAVEVCHAQLRMAVAATNGFEFNHAKQIIDYAMQQPMPVVGRLNYGKLLSSLGQIAAFLNQPDQARLHFEQAIAIFNKLSDPMQAHKEISQTRIYSLMNLIDARHDATDLQQQLTQHWGCSLAQAVEKFARSQDDRFNHHLLIRALVAYAEFDEFAQQYVMLANQWQCAQGHPWLLINAWRGWLLYQHQQPSKAAQYFNVALYADDGHEQQSDLTLMWIRLVMATLAQQLGLTTDYPVTQQLQQLSQTLTAAPHAALQTLTQTVVAPDQLLHAVAQCLPFNFK